MMRAPLTPSAVDRIRQQRIAPRPTQHDYLHLRGLLAALRRAFENLDVARGPVLDVYCGARPYESIIPWRPVWALDIDRHFGGANVIGSIPFPFRDGAFSVVVCTQALYLVDDPMTTVNEMRRVTMRGGYAVVTVPCIFRRESSAERRWTREDLHLLFRAWNPVIVAGVDGPAVGAALYTGQLILAATRRWPILAPVLSGSALVLNGTAAVAERLLRPLAHRSPSSLIVIARRPAD